MTIGRLVAWMMVWMSGWALFFIHPVGHSGLGSILLVAVAPLVMVSPGEWKDPAIRKGGIVVALSVCLFLFVVFVLPPSYTWQFPKDPQLLAGLKVLGALVAAFGIGVTGRRFVRDHAGAA